MKRVLLSDDILLVSGQHLDSTVLKAEPNGVPYLTGPTDFAKGKPNPTRWTNEGRAFCELGDVLVVVKGSGTGVSVISDGRYAIGRQLMAVRVQQWHAGFVRQILLDNSNHYLSCATGLIPGIARDDILNTPVISLRIPEQSKIAEILITWDVALEKLDALITAKERRKKALMQQLLTGKRRVKGFAERCGRSKSDRFGSYPADWRRVSLGEITIEVSARNAAGLALPVLSCTKHRGLVMSEEYFGKRVHAEDTSSYRLVTRGEFAYATNHIEEGSIGYQNICDAGLVSPIYTVFKSTGEVDDAYLYRVLKSPLLVHHYRVNTSSSVDRRGSLRYDEFSRIYIWLPQKEEQRAIANVLAVCDEELNLLGFKRDALDQQKRGLMQKLLTGAIRVRTEKHD